MIWNRLSLPLLLFLTTAAEAQLVDDLKFEWNSVSMPFPVSDVMANYMDGVIIITGGCNSLKGNERVNFGEGDLFACMSTSSKTLQFDPETNAFTELADMPNERQRHAAAVVNGELYLLGGRDSNDDLVKAIDSYNPTTKQWTKRGELPDDVVTSDLTAWTYGGAIYVTGGFQADYTAVGTTYRLDVSNNPTSFDDMAYSTLATSPHPRGDIHAVEFNGYAYIAGGLTHTSDWCEGLTTTERYHMATDTWEEIAPLSVGRADMAVTLFNGKIVSLGGETKPDDCKQVQDPAYGSFPADHVEVLLLHEDDAEWAFFSQFQDQRFRFAAAVVPDQSRLYTFGGQLPFDFTCDCFPTSDKVGVATEVFVTPESSSLEPGWIAFIVVMSVVGSAVILLCVRWMVRKSNVEKIESKTAEEFKPSGDQA